MSPHHFSGQSPSKAISLYRSLLSLTRTPKSQEEVIHFVIDSLYEIFPTHRISFSEVRRPGQVRIVYSRGPDGTPDVSGATFDISNSPQLVDLLFAFGTIETPDVRKADLFQAFLPKLLAFSPALSRMDVPFEMEGEVLLMLTVASMQPGEWPRQMVELVSEAGSMLKLIFRDLRLQVNFQESETIFRQFADNVEAVFWLTDVKKEKMIYVSPAYRQIWGRSQESLYQDPRSFLAAIHPDDRKRVARALEQQHLGYQQEYRVVKPCGEIRWIKDRGFPVRDEQGTVYRVAGIAEDITPLREAREKLEASRNQIASNAKFAALGEMASGIAHEINNPLAVIHGLAVQMQELVARSDRQFPVKMVLDSYESIEKMANRIAGIVKGLRTFSRQQAADPMQAADLNAILSETMAMCAPKIRAASAKVEVNRNVERLGIQCRSSEISQVILNLVNNAVDAVATADERLIKVEVMQRDCGVARLVVEDTGGGVRPELKERIFQPFFTTKEVGKGTGLGLSISKSIIEAHGGKLFLDQESPNTRFVVELPSENP